MDDSALRELGKTALISIRQQFWFLLIVFCHRANPLVANDAQESEGSKEKVCFQQDVFEAAAQRLLFKYPTRQVVWAVEQKHAHVDTYQLTLFELGDILLERDVVFKASDCDDAALIMTRIIDRFLLQTTPEDEVIEEQLPAAAANSSHMPAQRTQTRNEEVGLEGEIAPRQNGASSAPIQSNESLNVILEAGALGGLGFGGRPNQRPIFSLDLRSYWSYFEGRVEQPRFALVLGLEGATHRSLSFNSQRIGNVRAMAQVGLSLINLGGRQSRFALAAGLGQLNSRGIGFDQSTSSKDLYAEVNGEYGVQLTRIVGLRLRATMPLTRHRFQIENLGTVAEISQWIMSTGLTVRFY